MESFDWLTFSNNDGLSAFTTNTPIKTFQFQCYTLDKPLIKFHSAEAGNRDNYIQKIRDFIELHVARP